MNKLFQLVAGLFVLMMMFLQPNVAYAKPVLIEACGTGDSSEVTLDIVHRAESGDAIAQIRVARAFILGHSTPVKDEQVFEWLKQAALLENPKAQVLLGQYKLQHAQSESDFRQAAELFKLAADKRDPEALIALGSSLYGGIGVTQDKEKAFRLLAEAAELGCTRSEVLLGQFLLADDRNSKVGFEWIKRAADTGDSFGQEWLGICYLHGMGTQPNPAFAKNLLEAAYGKGDDVSAEAAYYLGMMYLVGSGGDKDEAKAYVWLQPAARADVEDSSKQLAELIQRLQKIKVAKDCPVYTDAELINKSTENVGAGESVALLKDSEKWEQVSLPNTHSLGWGYIPKDCF